MTAGICSGPRASHAVPTIPHQFASTDLRPSLAGPLASAPLLFALLLLPGCTLEETADEANADTESFYFEPIGYGQRAAIRDTIEVALRDQEAWDGYRDSLNPIAPFRSVDFSQAIVLLVALPQSTSGHSIDFASVDRIDSMVVAEYVVNVPGEDCLVAFSESVPFQAVLVRRTDLPVRFEHTTEEYRCTFGPRRR